MRRVAYHLRFLLLLGLPFIIQVGPSETAQARHALAFTPLPGPNIEWKIPDPSFQALSGARALAGVSMGASYRIEVPDNWNGELVIYAHGYRGSPPELTVSNPPVRGQLIERGFAWAASSFRNNGYVPGVGAQDSLNLKGLFTSLVGQPKRVYFYGTSMGGHAAVISAEFYPEAYDGFLSECGVVGGYDLFDFFTESAAAATYVLQSSLGSGALDAASIAEALGGGSRGLTRLGLAMSNIVVNLSGGPRPFAVEGLADYLATDVLTGAAGLTNPYGSPFFASATNQDTIYQIDPGFGITSADLNTKVFRKPADPAFRSRFGPYPELGQMTAEIRRPMLQIKGTGDLFVPIREERYYLQRAKEAGTTNLLVQRAIRSSGHCNFTTAERTRAFDDLVMWVRYGIRPSGEDLSGDLRNVGLQFTDPVRAGDPGTLTTRP